MKRTLAIVVLLACPAAFAQSSNEDQAKAHFTLGKGHQDLGEYAQAAKEFEQAYELDPRPEMLFNIAQAYRFANDSEQALAYFQKYLSAQPDGPGADEARAHVDELGKQLAAATAAPQAEPGMQPTPAWPAEKPPVAESSSPTLRITGLATIGAGAVAIGLAVKLGLDARAASDSISSHDTAWSIADHRAYDDAQTANRNMVISYAVGGALVLAGGTLYWLGSRTHVAPAIGPQSASLAIRGAF